MTTLTQTAAEALAHVGALEDKMKDPKYAERVRQSYEKLKEINRERG